MSHDDKAHEQAEEAVDISIHVTKDEDHWRHQMYMPTDEDREHWTEAGIPDDETIVGGFLLNNPLVYGVPDKTEIFRLADLVSDDPLSDPRPMDRYLHLRVVKAPYAYWHVLVHPHIVGPFSDIHEHNYTVRLSVVSVEMVLARLRVIHGSRTDDSEQIVFEGTECPRPATHGNIRVIRVTVHRKDFATYEVVSETRYPVRSWF